jgi:hypothetical protein
VFREGLVIGGLGTRIFNKSYAELKPPTGIGHTGLTITVIATFTARP